MKRNDYKIFFRIHFIRLYFMHHGRTVSNEPNCNYHSKTCSFMTCFSILNCALTRLRNQVEKCGISEIERLLSKTKLIDLQLSC